MGLHRSQKAFYFQWVREAHLRPVKGATLPVLRRINGFLSISQAGNKSGAPKLTIAG
jgi:hypothetical protein